MKLLMTKTIIPKHYSSIGANGLRLCDVPHSRMLKISTKVHSGILQNRCYGLAFNDNALDGLCKIHNN